MNGAYGFFFFLKEFLYFYYLFIYFWLCWVFISVQGLSPVVASGGHSSLRCAGLSLSQPLLLRSTGSRCAGSVVVAHGPSCSAACGIFPDQGSNPCPLHWQADSQPLRHQGSSQTFRIYHWPPRLGFFEGCSPSWYLLERFHSLHFYPGYKWSLHKNEVSWIVLNRHFNSQPFNCLY